MAKPTTFSCTAPDGDTFHRASHTKDYSFAILGRRTGGAFRALAWSGRRDLADKALPRAKDSNRHLDEFVIVPVTSDKVDA